MGRKELQAIASVHRLGAVHFQFHTARNTGRQFEVGYVFVNGRQELFCKRQSFAAEDEFYLCNEFRELVAVEIKASK